MDSKGYDRFESLWPLLAEDAKVAIKQADEDPTPFNRRSAVRAVFAGIEGATFIAKSMVLSRFPEHRKFFRDAEIALLKDEQYTLNSKGEAYAQPKYLRTDENFRFAIHMFMRGMPAEPELDLNSEGWQSLKRALMVRHRVTHPRDVSDLDISDAEFCDVKNAYGWAFGTIVKHIALALRGFILRDQAIKANE